MTRLLRPLALSGLLFGLAISPVLTAPALAQDAPVVDDTITVDKFVGEIEGRYKDVQTLTADFVQTNRSATMGEVKIRGKVTLKRPRYMLWDSTKEPGGALFVTDGNKIWSYTPQDKQVLVFSDLSAGAGGLDLLDSLERITERFDVRLISQTAGVAKKSVEVVLTPKEAGQYTEIRLIVHSKTYELEQLTMVDAFGGEVEYAFSQLKLNAVVPDTEFSFTPPAGVEVIEADAM